MSTDSFPQQYARTQRLTLGEPRNITVSSDGRKVVFLRSDTGDDPVNRLWVLDVESGHETLIADPTVMLDANDADKDAGPFHGGLPVAPSVAQTAGPTPIQLANG